jgi:hypothetical protein
MLSPPSLVGCCKHRLQQHIGTRGKVCGFGVFGLVVAQALCAGHEDHGRGGHACQIQRIMPRAAHDAPVAEAQRLRGALHQIDQLRREGRGRHVPDLLHTHIHLRMRGFFRRDGLQFREHALEHGFLRVTDVDGNRDCLGHCVACARLALCVADGAAAPGAACFCERKGPLDDPCRGAPWVAALLHRRGARVARDAGKHHVQPVEALYARHHADGGGLLFEDRALLDVRLEGRVDGVGRYRVFAAIADTFQFFAHRAPRGIGAAQGEVHVVLACEGAGAQHRRHETAAFLVGPRGHFHGATRADAAIVQHAYHLEPSKYAVESVEAPAGGLGVDVARSQHACR